MSTMRQKLAWLRKSQFGFGRPVMPVGVKVYHILPTVVFMNTRENRSYAKGRAYSITMLWMVWGCSVFIGR